MRPRGFVILKIPLLFHSRFTLPVPPQDIYTTGIEIQTIYKQQQQQQQAIMSVDDLNSGAAHHSDFQQGTENLSDQLMEGARSNIKLIMIVVVSFLLLARTFVKLAKTEQEQQQQKDR